MKASILIVEDSENIRLLVKTFLKKFDFDVVEVTNGLEACEYLEIKENKVDLILLDIMMPVMDGLRFLKKIKSDFSDRDIKVCIMSAKRDMQSVQQAISLGANDYLVKPVDREILSEKVSHLLGEGVSNPFAKVSVNIQAEIAGLPVKVPLKLLELSEVEVVMECGMSMEEGVEFSFYAPTLSLRFGEEVSFTCIVRSLKKEPERILICAEFVGMAEKVREVIRQIAVNQEEINDEK